MKNGPETFLKMLIRIDKSVADRAVNNDDVTLLVVQSIATAQAMGYHMGGEKRFDNIVSVEKP